MRSQLRLVFPFLVLSWLTNSCTTKVTAPFALQQSIAYHDPSTEWATFDDTLRIIATRPEGGFRHSTLHVDVARDIFSIRDSTRHHTVSYQWTPDSCHVKLNGSSDFTPRERDSLHLTCDRLHLLKDYYTFLYGLPMKLTDRGVNLIDTVATKTFKGKDYAVIEARFADNVGEDVWFIYLNPRSYRMEVYQFFDTDTNGQILPESGEYVLLDGEFFIGGMNIPETRSWYTNADDEFLGTDVLIR